MSPKKKKTADKKKGKTRYLFKITVLGPEDKLLEDVLRVFNPQVVAVDGIRIGATDVETDSSDVKAVFMSPKHAVLDVLLSVSFKGASGAIVVLRDPDPVLETLYRNEVREKLGSGMPTRIVTIGSGIDDFKRNEIIHAFDQVVEEILASKMKMRNAK